MCPNTARVLGIREHSSETYSLQVSTPSCAGIGEPPSPMCSWQTSLPPLRSSHRPHHHPLPSNHWGSPDFPFLSSPGVSVHPYSLRLPSCPALYVLFSGSIHRTPTLTSSSSVSVKAHHHRYNPPLPSPSLTATFSFLLQAGTWSALRTQLLLSPVSKGCFFFHTTRMTRRCQNEVGVLLLLFSRWSSFLSLPPPERPTAPSTTGEQYSSWAGCSPLKPISNLLLPAVIADPWPWPLPRSSALLFSSSSISRRILEQSLASFSS